VRKNALGRGTCDLASTQEFGQLSLEGRSSEIAKTFFFFGRLLE